MLVGENVVQRNSIRSCTPVERRDLHEGPLARGTARRSTHRQLRGICHLGSLVRRGTSGFHRDEFRPGGVATPKAILACVMDWHRAEPCASGYLQVSASPCGRTSLLLAAEVFALGSAPGHFVLDLSGDELFV